MHSQTRKWAARGGCVGVAVSLLLFVAPWADAAANATFNAQPTGYYTQTADPLKAGGQQGQTITCQPQVPADRRCTDAAQLTGGTPGYPRKDNYVYVANTEGDPDAIGAVAIPLYDIPFGATIQALSITIGADTSTANGAVNFQTDAPGFQACLATEGPAYQDAADYSQRPATDCSVVSLPKKGASQGAIVYYTIDLMPMASAWANGRENYGVMLLATPSAPANFEAALQSAGVNKASMLISASFVETDAGTFDFGPVDGGFSPSSDSLQTVTFGGVEDPIINSAPAPFKVAPAAPGPAVATRPFRSSDPQNKWWMFIGLPIGAAVLAALARGVAETSPEMVVARSGPVGRLMSRRSDEGV